MTLRLSEHDEQVLAAIAAEDGLSRHDATIRAIHEVAESRHHKQDVVAAAHRALDRYADVIERLGR